MPEWLISALASMGPLALIAAGGLWVRVQRVEKDVEQCVRRELYDVQAKGIDEKLVRIETMIERLFDRFVSHRQDQTDPGLRR